MWHAIGKSWTFDQENRFSERKKNTSKSPILFDTNLGYLTLEGRGRQRVDTRSTSGLLVEHKICSNMCGTPVQAVLTIKFDRVGRGGQGRSKSNPEWPEFGFGAVQRFPNGSMTPVTDPKWFLQLPLIGLSPDLLKHCSLYILKNINYLRMWKLLISEIIT